MKFSPGVPPKPPLLPLVLATNQSEQQSLSAAESMRRESPHCQATNTTWSGLCTAAWAEAAAASASTSATPQPRKEKSRQTHRQQQQPPLALAAVQLSRVVSLYVLQGTPPLGRRTPHNASNRSWPPATTRHSNQQQRQQPTRAQPSPPSVATPQAAKDHSRERDGCTVSVQTLVWEWRQHWVVLSPQCAFNWSMHLVILRFTCRHAFCCGLHRPTSRAIHH